jgi:secreted trypsin-like serine protease
MNLRSAIVRRSAGDLMHIDIDFRSRLYAHARWAFAAVVLSTALAAVTPARAIVYQDANAQSAGLGAGQAFLNGEAALRITFASGQHFGCSGSLVGGGAFVLTAAHCLTDDDGNREATSIALSFANSGLSVTATNYDINPNWVGTIIGGGDLAVIKLDTPILSIPSYQLDTTSTAVGKVVTLAGYGDTGVGDTGAKPHTNTTLRFGRNRYDFDYDDVPWVYEYDFDKVGDDSFNQTGGPAVGADEVDIGDGDSGGAGLMFIDGAWQIVGVHEFTICTAPGCDVSRSVFGEKAGDTSVFAYRDWLNAEIGVAPVPEPATWSLLTIGLVAIGFAVGRRRSEVEQRMSHN